MASVTSMASKWPKMISEVKKNIRFRISTKSYIRKGEKPKNGLCDLQWPQKLPKMASKMAQDVLGGEKECQIQNQHKKLHKKG